MRRIIIIISLILLSNSSLLAQDEPIKIKPFNIYVSAGLSSTSSPDWLNDFHSIGYNFEGAIGLKILPASQLLFKIGINNNPKDHDIYLTQLTFPPSRTEFTNGGRLKIMTFGTDFRFMPAPPLFPVKLYGFLGTGFAKIQEADIFYDLEIAELNDYYPETTISDQTKLYFNFGAGIEFGTGPIKFFFQVKYLQVKTKEQGELKFVPISFGAKF